MFVVTACDAYRILVVFPLDAKSHTILGNGIVRHLLNAGHEVTYITATKTNNQHANLTEIAHELVLMGHDKLDIEGIMDGSLIDINPNAILVYFMSGATKTIFESEKISDFLKDKTQHFDAVIIEWLFSDLYSVFSAVFDCPLIWFSSTDAHWQVTRLVDEALHPAYNSDILSKSIPPFSFVQRASELFVQLTSSVVLSYVESLENSYYESELVPIIKARGNPVPSYRDLVYGAALLLGNTHPSMGSPARLPQNYKVIGGYHMDGKVKPLPQDLKQLLDNAKNGLIYFSMGSNLLSTDLPVYLREQILKVFGELKQTVLWKFEEVLPDLPENVHIVQWAPQQSILAHPNTVLFITHGGILSITETLNFGKPIIGIPVFADQFINIEKSVHKGYGLKVPLSRKIEVDLRAAIHEITTNPKYAQKAKEWSFIYHDRPVSPGQELVHWTEHVIQTKGAPHLRSAATLVSWYQKMYLDLALVLVILSVASLYALKAIWRKISCCKTKKGSSDKKTQ